MLAVEVAHPADDLVVDLLRRLRQAELVVQVPRPLVASSFPSCPAAPARASARRARGRAARAPRPRPARSRSGLRRGRRRRRRSLRHVPAIQIQERRPRVPECALERPRRRRSVWSPTGHAGEQAALDPAERAFEERRAVVSLAELDPVPVRDGRNPAGEMLRDRFLAGGEQADREPAGLAQQLVERGRACDRDRRRAAARWRERRGSRRSGRGARRRRPP